MTTLDERKNRIRSSRIQRERSELAHKIDPHHTARILLALAALAMVFLTAAATIIIAGALP